MIHFSRRVSLLAAMILDGSISRKRGSVRLKRYTKGSVAASASAKHGDSLIICLFVHCWVEHREAQSDMVIILDLLVMHVKLLNMQKLIS